MPSCTTPPKLSSPCEAVATLLLIENSSSMSVVWSMLRDRYLPTVLRILQGSGSTAPPSTFFIESSLLDSEPGLTIQSRLKLYHGSSYPLRFEDDRSSRISTEQIHSSIDLLTSIAICAQPAPTLNLVIVAASTPLTDHQDVNPTSLTGHQDVNLNHPPDVHSKWFQLARRMAQQSVQCHLVLNSQEDMSPFELMFQETLRLRDFREAVSPFNIEPTEVIIRLSETINDVRDACAVTQANARPSLRRSRTRPLKPSNGKMRQAPSSQSQPEMPSLVEKLQQRHGLTRKKVKPPRPFFRDGPPSDRSSVARHWPLAEASMTTPVTSTSAGPSAPLSRLDPMARMSHQGPSDRSSVARHSPLAEASMTTPVASTSAGPSAPLSSLDRMARMSHQGPSDRSSVARHSPLAEASMTTPVATTSAGPSAPLSRLDRMARMSHQGPSDRSSVARHSPLAEASMTTPVATTSAGPSAPLSRRLDRMARMRHQGPSDRSSVARHWPLAEVSMTTPVATTPAGPSAPLSRRLDRMARMRHQGPSDRSSVARHLPLAEVSMTTPVATTPAGPSAPLSRLDRMARMRHQGPSDRSSVARHWPLAEASMTSPVATTPAGPSAPLSRLDRMARMSHQGPTDTPGQWHPCGSTLPSGDIGCPVAPSYLSPREEIPASDYQYSPVPTIVLTPQVPYPDLDPVGTYCQPVFESGISSQWGTSLNGYVSQSHDISSQPHQEDYISDPPTADIYRTSRLATIRNSPPKSQSPITSVNYESLDPSAVAFYDEPTSLKYDASVPSYASLPSKAANPKDDEPFIFGPEYTAATSTAMMFQQEVLPAFPEYAELVDSYGPLLAEHGNGAVPQEYNVSCDYSMLPYIPASEAGQLFAAEYSMAACQQYSAAEAGGMPLVLSKPTSLQYPTYSIGTSSLAGWAG